MKKWIKKHRVKIGLIILTIIGLTAIASTYVMSLIRGNEQGSFDISKFGTEYSTYCINSLILYSYMKIRILQQYKIQRKAEQLLRIDKIDSITLPNNCISESVEINIDCGYVKYDLFFNKYNRKIIQIAVLNIFVCVCGIIPYFLYHASKTNYIILAAQILVGLFNILYFVLGELEHSEIKFLAIKLSQNIKDCEEKINEKYEEFMTFHIQRESIVTYGKQPYYVIQYSKLKNKYRVIFGFLFAIGYIYVVIFTTYYNFWNGLLFTIYPNVLLIAFCMVSNQTYYQKIFQHKVTIEEYTKGKISEYKEREINKLIYQANIIKDKKENKKSYIISIMDMTEQKAMLEGFKKHMLNKSGRR